MIRYHQNIPLLRLLGLILCTIFSLSACGGGGGPSDGGAPPQATAPVITTNPAAAKVSAGSSATFTVTVTGSAPLSYQWQLSTNGGVSWLIAPGPATSSSYATPVTTIAYNGYNYRVQISNSAGSVSSQGALLTVSAAPSVERQINATSTDSSITATPSSGEVPHVAINPSASVSAQGKLLVFLPGTQSSPTQYTYILRAAATRGVHAIGLNYPNQTAMATLCQRSTDPECFWTARNEVIFGRGTPVSGQSAVTNADSIVNRLNKLLASLNTNYPAEGWGQFLLADNTVNWGKVLLAGHSQGGGHTGVLAKTVSLSRAVYFSSPEDWYETTDTPANWTSTKPNVTPASQQFGLGASADPLVTNAHASEHWTSLGLYKPGTFPVLVDGSTSPFSGSHQLRTSQSYNPASTAPTVALKNHGITVVDTSTPVDGSGNPLFDSNGVWAYLCFQ